MMDLGDFHDALIEAEDTDDRYCATTALYRYFTADGVLAYVGVSNQPIDRHWNHSGRPWAPTVRFMRVCFFPVRYMAEYAESCAIRDEGPLHNVQYRSYARWPRGALWYHEKMKGRLCGEGIAWFRLDRWHEPTRCEQPEFWKEQA